MRGLGRDRETAYRIGGARPIGTAPTWWPSGGVSHRAQKAFDPYRPTEAVPTPTPSEQPWFCHEKLLLASAVVAVSAQPRLLVPEVVLRRGPGSRPHTPIPTRSAIGTPPLSPATATPHTPPPSSEFTHTTGCPSVLPEARRPPVPPRAVLYLPRPRTSNTNRLFDAPWRQRIGRTRLPSPRVSTARMDSQCGLRCTGCSLSSQ